jgi:hypothetical protein
MAPVLEWICESTLDCPLAFQPASIVADHKTNRRAIDIHEGEKSDESAFKTLVRQAVALNTSKSKPAKKAKSQENQWDYARIIIERSGLLVAVPKWICGNNRAGPR